MVNASLSKLLHAANATLLLALRTPLSVGFFSFSLFANLALSSCGQPANYGLNGPARFNGKYSLYRIIVVYCVRRMEGACLASFEVILLNVSLVFFFF